MDNWKASVTFGLALVGATLGVLNFLRAVNKDRVRLKVVPTLYVQMGGVQGLCIEVINLGYIPATVTQIGISLPKAWGAPMKMNFVAIEDYRGCIKLPERMEPRTSLTVFFSPAASQDDRLATARKAYAKTACGRTFKGTSKAFKSFVKKLRGAI